MARSVTAIEIFVSGPSDVDSEKEIISDVINEWNNTRGRDVGIVFSTLSWADIVSPKFGARAQETINEQIGDTYDIFMGIMWSRYGAPTGASDSGTVEEFDRALTRQNSGKDPIISMFFKMDQIDPSVLDGEQFAKVQSFKKRCELEGGLYREFIGEEEFRVVVNRFIEEVVRRGTISTSQLSTELLDDNIEAIVYDDSPVTLDCDRQSDVDMGLFELNEELSSVTAQQVQFFDDLGVNSSASTEVLSTSSSEMESLVARGTATQSTLKPIIDKICASMNGFSDFIESRLPEFSAGNLRLIELSDIGLDISVDFKKNGQESSQDELFEAIEGLLPMLDSNVNSSRDLISTIIGLPRLSTPFNAAKTRLSKAQSALMTDILHLRERLNDILDKHRT
jgi:hypothetical protein